MYIIYYKFNNYVILEAKRVADFSSEYNIHKA